VTSDFKLYHDADHQRRIDAGRPLVRRYAEGSSLEKNAR